MLAVVVFIITALLSNAIPGQAFAIRVPENVGTIQGALDSTGDGDTVLVALGIYAEALQAPPHSFALIGNVQPDTGEYPRPIIDPSPLPGSDSLACLILPLGSSALIENFKFRNGEEMFPRWNGLPGGIISQADRLSMRHCLIDTVARGLGQFGFADSLIIEDCLFRGDSSWCLYALTACQLTNCFFSGAGSYLARVGAHSRIVGCQFEHNGIGGNFLLQPYGLDNTIRQCIFGPDDDPQHGEMLFISRTSGQICENVFMNSAVWLAIHLHVSEGETLEVVENHFVNLSPGGVQTGTPIRISEETDQPDGGFLWIHDNDFSSCTADGLPNAIDVIRPAATIERNHFFHLAQTQFPAIEQYTGFDPGDSIILRENLFYDVGLAARGGWNMDARWNWWGDASGPRHSTRNPEGQGEEVQGDLTFDPWYPDTTFLASPHPRVPVPQQVSLSVYPNPFNASASLKLAVNQPGIFTIDLYNLLGQHVQTIWSGAIAYEKQITFDGQSLSSGIYFVRVWQPIENHSVALQKVVIAK